MSVVLLYEESCVHVFVSCINHSKFFRVQCQERSDTQKQEVCRKKNYKR